MLRNVNVGHLCFDVAYSDRTQYGFEGNPYLSKISIITADPD